MFQKKLLQFGKGLLRIKEESAAKPM